MVAKTITNNDQRLERDQHDSGILSNLRYDFPAGIVVFLVALPFCLGIAMASGAPLFSGLIAGVIGGVVVGALSGSAVGVSGPAAGLSVIVFAAIQDLGFEAYLLALVIAGIFQIIMGLLKAGIVVYYFPSSVITGMVSGIGIILFLKQIPHALGYDTDYEGDLDFFQSDDYSTFSELSHMLNFIELGAVIIAAISLFILLVWEQPQFKRYRALNFIHGPLAAVTAGVLINQLLIWLVPERALGAQHLVQIPEVVGVTALLGQFSFPEFSQLTNPKIYVIAFTLAVVASLETLLSTEATDKLDPYKRITPSNRELIAQGAGNTISGLIGGLPVTQVIVRSSANIQSGARTKASALIHGMLLLVMVTLIPGILNLIPLASLAAILIVVGYKLARPEIFVRMFRTGMYHFMPFVVTILGLLFTDLLTGITIGFVIALVSVLRENYKTTLYMREDYEGNKKIFRLSENVSFLNKADISNMVNALPAGSEVIIDATKARYIDYDVYEILQNFKAEAYRKKIKMTLVNLRGFGALEPVRPVLPYTQETRDSLTPEKVLDTLTEGNIRFVNSLKSNRNLLQQANETRKGQFPIAIILSCIDSRTSVELIFDLGLGDVFSARVAGNIVNDDILGSMEFACKIAGSKLIVVLGHSHCGAIKGACSDVKMDHLTGLLEKIKPAIALVKGGECKEACSDDKRLVQSVAETNVKLMVDQIKTQSVLLHTMFEGGEIGIVGGMHDIETGTVTFFPPNDTEFR